MEPLSLGASLPHIQDYVRHMEIERGLDSQDLSSQCLKLGEEVGELYRAVRKLQGQPQDPAGRTADVGDEAVDALGTAAPLTPGGGGSRKALPRRLAGHQGRP